MPKDSLVDQRILDLMIESNYAQRILTQRRKGRKRNRTDITLWRGTRLSIFLVSSLDTTVLTNSSPLRETRLPNDQGLLMDQ